MFVAPGSGRGLSKPGNMENQFTHTQLAQFDEIEEMLMEAIIDVLDNDSTKLCEAIAGLEDPAPPEETDLHERMAKAAIQVYIETVQPVQIKV